MLILMLSMMACGEDLLSYQCTCVQAAYSERGELVFEDDFSLNICETEAAVNDAFEADGVISTETQACEERLKVDYSDASCECDCEYLGLCQG